MIDYKLDDLLKRIASLEQRVAQLEARSVRRCPYYPTWPYYPTITYTNTSGPIADNSNTVRIGDYSNTVRIGDYSNL